jgi:hypothetical protein
MYTYTENMVRIGKNLSETGFLEKKTSFWPEFAISDQMIYVAEPALPAPQPRAGIGSKPMINPIYHWLGAKAK